MPEDEDEDKGKKGMSAEEVRLLVKSIMDQGRGPAELEKYLEQNFKLRNKNSILNEKVTELEKKVPAEGTLVLAGDDLKEHNELVALGKKAKEIKKVLESHEALVEKTTKLEREQLVSKIAEAEGWKAPLLDRLTKGMDLVLEDSNEDVDDGEGGTKKAQVKRGFVQKTEGGTTTKVRLSEELKDLLASLAKEDSGGDEGEEGKGDLTPFPKQVRGETGGKGKSGGDLKGVAGKHIGSRYVVPGKEKEAK